MAKKEAIEQLREYKALLDDGVITQDDFNQLKNEILFGGKDNNNKTVNNETQQVESESNNTEDKPKEENKQENNQEQVSTVVCSQCGSNSCSKIDDYTYKCNHCGTIINLKRPDVAINNYNSFASNTGDIPIYKYKKTVDETTFLRDSILELAKAGDISPSLLSNFRSSPTSVLFGYLTFADVEYSVDVSYSCQVGTDYKVEYYDNQGNKKTKTETKWEPFSGNGNDGGNETVSCFGEETKTDLISPIFIPNNEDEQEEFTNEQKYPLKKNVDRSTVESLKSRKISSLEYSLKSNLPGNHVRNWSAHGRCQVSQPNVYHYVPTFSLFGKSNEHDIWLSASATKSRHIFYYLPEGENTANVGDETKPTRKVAKKSLGKKPIGKLFTSLFFILIALIIASVIAIGASKTSLGTIFGYVGTIFSLGVFIALLVVRSKTIESELANLVSGFEAKKLTATKECLSANNLAPLSSEESAAITSTKTRNLHVKSKTITLSILSGVALTLSILSLVFALVPSGGSSPSPSTQYYSILTENSDYSAGEISSGGKYRYGETAMVEAEPYSGYSFDGWYSESGSLLSTSSYYSFIVTSDKTLIACWTTTYYDYCTVTLQNDNPSAGTVSGSGSYEYGSYVTVTATPNTGYTFDGWYTTGGSKESSNSSYAFTVTSDKNLVAKWFLAKCTVTLQNNNPSAGTISGNRTYNRYDVVTITATPNTGYSFDGWYTTGGSKVSSNSSYTFNIASDVTLVAKWNQQIKCLFKNYNGSVLSTQYVDSGATVVYSGATPTKPDAEITTGIITKYEFNNWDKQLTNITSDTTFTAQFASTDYYKCTFVNYDGTELYVTSTFSGGQVEYKGKTPTKPQYISGTNVTSYTFSSWDKSLANISSPTIFTAQYSSTTFTGYKVTFLDSDSSELYSYYCKSGTTAIYPYSTPFSYDDTNVKQFVGWSDTLENITSPKTVTAQYATISRSQNGEYPQSLVQDTSLISALDKITTTDSNGYKTYGGNKYYQYDGESYIANDGTEIESGFHYYKVEPIQWKYLSDDGSATLLTSEYLLDAKEYNEYYYGTDESGNYANNYKASEIREWLNSTFLNQAFSDQSKIATTTVDNSVASTGYSSNPYICPTTYDKLFLLSYKEITDYMSTNQSRCCKTTEFARARGVSYSTNESYKFNGYWWSRSPSYYHSDYARSVDHDGSVYYNYVNYSDYGVRLALRLSLDE